MLYPLSLFIIFACVFKNVNKLGLWYEDTPKYLGESVTGMEIRLGKEMKGFGAFIVFGVLAQMLADVQMNISSSGVHAQWFSHWKIRADEHDIIS